MDGLMDVASIIDQIDGVVRGTERNGTEVCIVLVLDRLDIMDIIIWIIIIINIYHKNIIPGTWYHVFNNV